LLRPNFLIIFFDDVGYGDLGCYGSPINETPRLDKLAAEGIRFTNFYAQTVCGPSRSALLTGRYPHRSMGWQMPADEITFATKLKTVGYKTCCIGKWDVSDRKPILNRMPNAKGFDYYWGPLGANDAGYVILYENNDSIGKDFNMATLSRRYTDRAINFIQENRDTTFFLYLAHSMMHVVIDASDDFKGTTVAGLYGDALKELDYQTGRLLDSLDAFGLRDNTLVLFTSDNGPWSNHKGAGYISQHVTEYAGNSGPLRGAKGSTYEGGFRVPGIVRWPGVTTENSVSDAIFSTLDLMPTLASITGYEVPADRVIDGVNQLELLNGEKPEGNRDNFLYFYPPMFTSTVSELQAVRKGEWKLRFPALQYHISYIDEKGSGEMELYNLRVDIGESVNLVDKYPEIVNELRDEAMRLR
jgi:arylsulfatase A-like enzyme